MKDINKFRGCLIGGAIGDALGYAVEFTEDRDIFAKYGANGITEYDLVNNTALISDDTQMTLFTANGLLLGTTRGMMRGIMGTYPSYIALCYKDWLKTQTAEEFGSEPPEFSWLNNVPEMNHSRAPGGTCISYLMHNDLGTTAEPKNNSKGCGGVMRVAPIGLYFDDSKKYSLDEIDMIGAEAAALTHGHELGYIPAAMLVHMVNLLSHKEISVLDAVQDAKNAMPRLFPNAVHLSELTTLTEKAIRLAAENIDDLDAIRELGQGWVAEETIAIAIYCSVKYSRDFEKAMIAAVNHSGDSDSTGAVTGNILGAYLGINAIPEKFLENLELKDTILEVADDLFNDCRMTEYGEYRDDVWVRKYIKHTYPGR